MKTSQFKYNLPDSLIAKYPSETRGGSRLLAVDRSNGAFTEGNYGDFINYLNSGDVLVLNNTKVRKARIALVNPRNSKNVNCLFLNQVGDLWECLIGYARNVKIGDRLQLEGKDSVEIVSREISNPYFSVRLLTEDSEKFFEDHGSVPLPAYVDREAQDGDETRYNTVFARDIGSSAAPTASLNMTEELIAKIEAKGVKILYITLDVGWGTFAPVRTENIEDFKIHSEQVEVTEGVVAEINSAKARGSKVMAIGTTVVRSIESATKMEDGKPVVYPFKGATEIYITPGYEFKCIDMMLTNFHASESSLIMLVSAFAGYDLTMSAYQYAIDREYRFLSYGDSMLIHG